MMKKFNFLGKKKKKKRKRRKEKESITARHPLVKTFETGRM